ncbi:hypothetical protein UlMin_029447 [Ulmus minor]
MDPETCLMDIVVNMQFLLSWSSLRDLSPLHSYVWVKPPEGWIKVNFDAAVSDTCFIAGVVAQSYVGTVICFTTSCFLPYSSLVAEAKAYLLVVKLVADNGWKFCVFKGDAKLVIDACRLLDDCLWEIRPIISDIFSFALVFVAWDFVFVFREANFAAHDLAASAMHHYIEAS